MAGRAAAAVEADVAVDGVADPLQQFEVELLGDRVAAVEVADRGGVRVDPGLGYERRGTLRSGEATRTGLTPAGDDELMLDQLLNNYLQRWAHSQECCK